MVLRPVIGMTGGLEDSGIKGLDLRGEHSMDMMWGTMAGRSQRKYILRVGPWEFLNLY